jgi:hypothetical protein
MFWILLKRFSFSLCPLPYWLRILIVQFEFKSSQFTCSET